jgi:uncharacterized membrane protein YvlD (DUF360 family)
LVALLLRALTGLYIFYYQPAKDGPTFANSFFSLASFVVPISFSAVGIYMLTGQPFWQTSSGWMLLAVEIISLFALATSFIYWRIRQVSAGIQLASRALILLLAVMSAIVAQIVVSRNYPHLLSLPYAIFMILVASVILWQTALLTTSKADHGMWWYLSMFAIVAPLLLAFANSPWLVFGKFTLEQAYGAHAYGLGVLISLAVILPVMLLGWGLLAWALSDKNKTGNS